ncbi:DNA-binding response regulator [Putridiphycobacter roseus]|uniref:DNA-binding response regulator n=1 Tax=Putridiphycobacter roseus TaxID=2219161 RepID=A0A2W1N1W8_9FLAO|nr:response regulator transcription factor [Putridiphycobacter roseus]PZE17794.1 DNA-binding response regulator [Putridiphycobacter roseus]
MKILLIEDNEALNESITNAITNAGFYCESVFNYRMASEKIAIYEYDLIIIDINLPDGSGLDLIKASKKKSPLTGNIVISARNSTDQKVQGLELGADDYITKPFANAELIARIKSLLRRSKFDGSNILHFNAIKIDLNERVTWVNEQPIKLTKSEFDMLIFFISNVNRVLTKEAIAEHIWGDNMDLSDSFDFIYSHIKNIRKKIQEKGGENYIKAVYGIGYKFTANS